MRCVTSVRVGEGGLSAIRSPHDPRPVCSGSNLETPPPASSTRCRIRAITRVESGTREHMRVGGADGTSSAALGGSVLTSLEYWEVALHVDDTRATFGLGLRACQATFKRDWESRVGAGLVSSPPPAGGGVAMHDSLSHACKDNSQYPPAEGVPVRPGAYVGRGRDVGVLLHYSMRLQEALRRGSSFY